MNFDSALFLLTPFWLAMVFINAKVMIEVNREWNIDKQEQESVKLSMNKQQK